MIKIICGAKGKGKTKEMLARAESAVKEANGIVVYIDKSEQHMYELNNQIRLINITEYPVDTFEGFVGFVSGLLAGNHDIETVFVDSLLKVSKTTPDLLEKVVDAIDNVSSEVDFVVSVSADKDDLPSSVYDKIDYSC